MKKSITTAVLSASLFVLGTQAVLAEKIAVVGDLAFIADKGLTVKNISTGLPNACLAAPYLDPQGVALPAGALLTATDVVIKDNNAVVTVTTDTGVDIKAVDVTACVKAAQPVDVTECISTVNLKEGLLIIPCVEVDGKVVTVHMEQRGNSSNWEVKFLGDNVNFSHDDDDEDDDDDSQNGKRKK